MSEGTQFTARVRAIEAAAEAWFRHVQEGRMDAGRFKDDGSPIGWDDLNRHDRHAYRTLVAPIVDAATPALTEAH